MEEQADNNLRKYVSSLENIELVFIITDEEHNSEEIIQLSRDELTKRGTDFETEYKKLEGQVENAEKDQSEKTINSNDIQHIKTGDSIRKSVSTIVSAISVVIIILAVLWLLNLL